MSKVKALFSGNNSMEALLSLVPDAVTFDDLYECYSYLRERCFSFETPNRKVFDVCGTGGSGANRVNLSTILALKLMREGFCIAKHANRGASGKVGSIDILEKTGIMPASSPQEAHEMMDSQGGCFLFAPFFHPELKKVSEVRKAIGKPTVFNFVMPLLNPVQNITAQMIGCSNIKMMEMMSEIAVREGRNIIFVHDVTNKLDDVSIIGETHIIEVRGGVKKEIIILPESYGFKRISSFSEIAGFADVEQNAGLAMSIMNASAPAGYMDFLGINHRVATNFFSDFTKDD